MAIRGSTVSVVLMNVQLVGDSLIWCSLGFPSGENTVDTLIDEFAGIANPKTSPDSKWGSLPSARSADSKICCLSEVSAFSDTENFIVKFALCSKRLVTLCIFQSCIAMCIDCKLVMLSARIFTPWMWPLHGKMNFEATYTFWWDSLEPYDIGPGARVISLSYV